MAKSFALLFIFCALTSVAFCNRMSYLSLTFHSSRRRPNPTRCLCSRCSIWWSILTRLRPTTRTIHGNAKNQTLGMLFLDQEQTYQQGPRNQSDLFWQKRWSSLQENDHWCHEGLLGKNPTRWSPTGALSLITWVWHNILGYSKPRKQRFQHRCLWPNPQLQHWKLQGWR